MTYNSLKIEGKEILKFSKNIFTDGKNYYARAPLVKLNEIGSGLEGTVSEEYVIIKLNPELIEELGLIEAYKTALTLI